MCNTLPWETIKTTYLMTKSIFQCSKSGKGISSTTQKLVEINTCDGKVKWFVPNNSGKAGIEVSSGWQFYNLT